MAAVNDETEVPDELTTRMIDLGSRMLAEHGVAGLSLRKLADAAGTSTMSVYTRFGGKQELLATMHREGFRRLGAVLAEPPADTVLDVVPGPMRELAAVGLAYRRAAIASPALYGLMFGPVPTGLEPNAADSAASQATYEPLLDGCRRGVAAGVLTGEPERIALHLWAVAHGMVSLELSGRIALAAEVAELTYLQALDYAVRPFRDPHVEVGGPGPAT